MTRESAEDEPDQHPARPKAVLRTSDAGIGFLRSEPRWGIRSDSTIPGGVEGVDGAGIKVKELDVLGSHGYAAPEQLKGEKENIGPWTDTYALGATLFRLLCGRTPFLAATFARRLSNVDAKPEFSPRHFNKDVPRGLDKLVMKALAPKIKKRFQNGNELNKQLGEYC